MRLSDSFDDPAFKFTAPHQGESYEPSASTDGPQSTPASSSPESMPSSHWQSQLLPVARVRAEEDVTILREQLEAAHQLLRYQQEVVDSLTEQLVSCQTHVTQVEQDLEASKTNCVRQSAQLDDVESVCHDLKSQLRRQQDRIDEYRQAMQQLDALPLSVAQLSGAQSGFEFDYEAFPDGITNPETLAKASPVKPWSASDESLNLTGPIALYRKLAAMTMAAASRHSQASERYGQHLRQPLKSANTLVSNNLNPPATPTRLSVELPNFI